MEARAVAPSTPSSLTDVGGVLVITYDLTGRATVHIEGWPLIAWNIDSANPINPMPITLGNPIKTPPNTGAIVSPAWAYVVTDDAVYVPDQWRGTLPDFFTWLATNNGASRTVSTWFTSPRAVNAWNLWARQYPGLVTPP